LFIDAAPQHGNTTALDAGLLPCFYEAHEYQTRIRIFLFFLVAPLTAAPRLRT
jgi:hypothetical protein